MHWKNHLPGWGGDQSESSNPGRGLEAWAKQTAQGTGPSPELCIGNNGLQSDVLEEACAVSLLSSHSYSPYLFASLLRDIFRYLPLPGAPATTKLVCSAEVRIILKRCLQHWLSQLASDLSNWCDAAFPGWYVGSQHLIAPQLKSVSLVLQKSQLQSRTWIRYLGRNEL